VTKSCASNKPIGLQTRSKIVVTYCEINQCRGVDREGFVLDSSRCNWVRHVSRLNGAKNTDVIRFANAFVRWPSICLQCRLGRILLSRERDSNDETCKSDDGDIMSASSSSSTAAAAVGCTLMTNKIRCYSVSVDISHTHATAHRLGKKKRSIMYLP